MGKQRTTAVESTAGKTGDERKVACVAGAGVAVLGALGSFRLLPGRARPVEVTEPVLATA